MSDVTHTPEDVAQDETDFPHYASHYPALLNVYEGLIGCSCGQDFNWTRHDQVIAAYAEHVALVARDETEDAIFEPINSRVSSREAAPLTAANLRYAATHEALCRSWIFDVLTGLADYLDPSNRDVGGEA